MGCISTLSRKRRGEWCILAHYPLKNSRIVEKWQSKFHQSVRMCANICHSYVISSTKSAASPSRA